MKTTKEEMQQILIERGDNVQAKDIQKNTMFLMFDDLSPEQVRFGYVMHTEEMVKKLLTVTLFDPKKQAWSNCASYVVICEPRKTTLIFLNRPWTMLSLARCQQQFFGQDKPPAYWAEYYDEVKKAVKSEPSMQKLVDLLLPLLRHDTAKITQLAAEVTESKIHELLLFWKKMDEGQDAVDLEKCIKIFQTRIQVHTRTVYVNPDDEMGPPPDY